MFVLALIFALQANWWDALPRKGWTVVGGDDAVAIFIQPGPRPSLHWQRFERRTADLGVRSSRVLVEVDCAGGRSRYIQDTYFSQPNLEGSVVDTSNTIGDWSYVEPGTLGEGFLRAACR
jgi:hypothetical protein